MGTLVQKAMSSVQDYVSSSSVNRFWSSSKKTSVVEVQAFAGSTMVTMGDKKYTPVMVRVAAPPLREQQPVPRIPVDVVAVLNTSKSMDAMRSQMKEAMMTVIEKLDGKDRFSLVTLEEQHAGMELVHMEESSSLTAKERIRSITDRRWSTECSVTETVLQKVAVEMSKTRASEERLRCVMLLSCVQDQVEMTQWITEIKKHEFQFHTFDLDVGAQAQQQHGGGRFKCVAEARAHGNAGAYYHYIHSNSNTTSITDAVGKFVAGLKTVVATSVSVEVSLKAEAAGLSMLPLGQTAGGHCGSGGDHHIHIADMHAGEKKSFVFYLHSSANQEVAVSMSTVEKFLSIKGEYQQGCSSSSEKPQPCLLHGKEIKNEEVAAEVVRSMLVQEVKETIVEQTTEVQEKWETIKSSDVYKVARNTDLVKHIEEDVGKIQEGRLHMMSWLSCHWWQRTTTTCMSHYDDAFRASSSSTTITTTTGRQPCPWVVGVLFLVLVVILLGRLIISGRRRPLPAVRPTALDVGKHPEWPAMVSDIEVVLSRAKEGRIISFFRDKGASARDMNQQIDQYLYMAILYASVLRARYDGTSAFSEKVVRRHAETYIQSMLTRTKTGALPYLQVASTEATTKAMSQYLYSTIVQTEVLVTIRPPGLVIDETEKLRDENETLRKEIAELQREIENLRREKESCCKRADECEKKAARNSNYGWGNEI